MIARVDGWWRNPPSAIDLSTNVYIVTGSEFKGKSTAHPQGIPSPFQVHLRKTGEPSPELENRWGCAAVLTKWPCGRGEGCGAASLSCQRCRWTPTRRTPSQIPPEGSATSGRPNHLLGDQGWPGMATETKGVKVMCVCCKKLQMYWYPGISFACENSAGICPKQIAHARAKTKHPKHPLPSSHRVLSMGM